MKKSIFTIAILMFAGCALAMTPIVSHAQNIQIVNAGDVFLATNPELPGPFEKTTLSLESFVINLDTSGITWILDGKQIASGVGEKSITVTTRDIGDPLLVEVRIKWNQIDTLVKRVRIEPAYIDLLWEATNSYTPPFYRGKALPTSESFLRVVALPSGIITEDQYVYTWEHNGVVQQDASGFKKHALVIRNNFFDKRFQVGVTVTGRLRPFQARASLTVPRYEPEIHFAVETIDQSPIVKQNGGFTIAGQFNRLIAHPYYFSTSGGVLKNLDIAWSIDGERYFPTVSLSGLNNEIPLVPSADGSGFSNVSVQIANTNEILQQATAETQIRF